MSIHVTRRKPDHVATYFVTTQALYKNDKMQSDCYKDSSMQLSHYFNSCPYPACIQIYQRKQIHISDKMYIKELLWSIYVTVIRIVTVDKPKAATQVWLTLASIGPLWGNNTTYVTNFTFNFVVGLPIWSVFAFGVVADFAVFG